MLDDSPLYNRTEVFAERRKIADSHRGLSEAYYTRGVELSRMAQIAFAKSKALNALSVALDRQDEVAYAEGLLELHRLHAVMAELRPKAEPAGGNVVAFPRGGG